MNRRQVLTGGVAGSALVLGAAWGWQRHQKQTLSEANALWALSFDSPSGQVIALSDFKGRPLLINFWATWCPPCIEEMPLLDAFYQQHQAKGWQVLGLAIDNPAAVNSFLSEHPVRFPIGQASLGGAELSRSLGNTHGSLPFTVVINSQGRVVFEQVGSLNEADLRGLASTI